SEDYFSLMVFGLIGAIVLAQGSILRAIPMVVLGLLFGLVGSDDTTGVPRFTLDVPELADGISFVALTIGLFGITEVIRSLDEPSKRTYFRPSIRNILPTKADFLLCKGAIARGTLVGSALGLLPGGGALLAAYGAYALEKKLADTPQTFGQGDMRGVA